MTINKTGQGLIAIALIILVVVVAIFIGNLGNIEEIYCKNNPDECVCEEWKYIDYRGEHIIDSEIHKEFIFKDGDRIRNEYAISCNSFHKLTPIELQEKDCNDNPREDEDCKCVEYNEDILDDLRGIGGELLYHNILDNQTIEQYHRLMNYVEDNIICTKSIPKTPCEKGDEDWVEEVNEYCGDRKDINNILVCLGNESFKECCNTFNRNYREETTCRLKTDEEKGCKTIQHERELVFGFKTVWQKKECEI